MSSYTRLALAAIFLAVLLLPAWWAAGRLRDARPAPLFRLVCAFGLALLGYVACVNLLGRATGNSIRAVWLTLLLSAGAGAALLWRRGLDEFRTGPLAPHWRAGAGVLVLALVVGLPQWLLGVSSNYWDEMACSAIHVTAPNQFAEGIFPPRHNALPEIGIKYHYGFTILSGTVTWLLGIPATNAIDVVSTGLWLFVFLFVLLWLRALAFDRLAAGWGAFAVLLGGGLAWLYLPRIEAYSGVEKTPPAGDLLHRHDAAAGWLRNLLDAVQAPSLHLRNADGSLSNLPWDIAAQFQQHAVALGIAMTLVALHLLVRWQTQPARRPWLLAANVVAFGAVPLGHAVFGAVAAATAGLCLLLAWLRQRTWARFLDGLLFVPGVAVLAYLHGGMLASGAEYGEGSFATARRTFGYMAGGLRGFLDWNVAGFGLPLALALLAWALHRRRRAPGSAPERDALFTALTVFALLSYFVPQLFFYSSGTYGDERYTEISKFFFAAHFAFALLSAYGVASLGRAARWPLVAPCFLAAAVQPLAFCYAHAFDAKGDWLGFYYAPYRRGSIEERMGKALRDQKAGPRDVYFDASADERRHGYLSEMLVFGGSVFTMTPSRFERTGVGFRLSNDVVARRFVQNGRVARLLPGAAEEAGCDWYYVRPVHDMALAPLVVRSRFAKLVAEGALVKRAEAAPRALYAFAKPTAGLDEGIEAHWSPKLVSPAAADCDGDGRNDLVFYDYRAKTVSCGDTSVELPAQDRGEFANLLVGRFPGDRKVDFHVGRLKDTHFRLGTRIDDVVEQSSWAWTYRDSRSGRWEPEYERWSWDRDIPFVADLDDDGYDSHVAYRPQTGEWVLAPIMVPLPGPKVDRDLLPIPFGGRFLEGSRGDLGLWSLWDGKVTLQSIASGKSVSFRLGGTYDFVLVPGDYDGDGYDEIAVWNRATLTWYWRRAPEGPLFSAAFGSETGIPLPADFDNDGRVDLAYWEPRERKIFASFDRGRTVGLTIDVPPHSLPAFVNMY